MLYLFEEVIQNAEIVKDTFTTLVSVQQMDTLKGAECSEERRMFATDTILQLAFPPEEAPPEKQTLLLSDLLDFHAKKEELEEPARCDACFKCCKTTKETKCYADKPEILTIHLKRFRYARDENGVRIPTKIDREVRYPIGLQWENDMYDLSAVINHRGNASNGHYTAFINKEKVWSDFNDGKVQPLPRMDDASAIQSKEAYMLVYTKCPSPKRVDTGKNDVVLKHVDVLPRSVQRSTVDMDCESDDVDEENFAEGRGSAGSEGNGSWRCESNGPRLTFLEIIQLEEAKQLSLQVCLPPNGIGPPPRWHPKTLPQTLTLI